MPVLGGAGLALATAWPWVDHDHVTDTRAAVFGHLAAQRQYLAAYLVTCQSLLSDTLTAFHSGTRYDTI